MKQAKASFEEVQRLAEWLTGMEEHGYPVPSWRRVVHGYQVLFDNCCDPDLDYLEWKPEYKAMIKPTDPKPTEEASLNTPSSVSTKKDF